ncbi:4-deoxy-L-threo-5-hexosulose-uronate ketol-isomerase [Microbulbifer donghaiensis]|uniref:4-deoxy-L-threo-5-hexosulose-uronate ketol-isomerase n=1 Tax=Microbulbifer donghaiensis TaxID=494016 RepID=A0A1M5DYG3_9GAMM|nr:5-dehydro-4-deoxy-D-glucuronate isomerase [Microbulbifer donghaiensis]SHF72023.1 4-deoxy-L-threo-5-hexosulose-uronate ketol-isomerase [Microbulbifer donghaiensis]
MTTVFDERFACHPADYVNYDTERLRQEFLVPTLFEADTVRITYTHVDRMIVGGVMPVAEEVKLETVDTLKADYFLERRELGVINVGGPGCVEVDGTVYEIGTKEALYVSRGSKEVKFSSNVKSSPAKFYINSTPAHRACPTRKVGQGDAQVIELGASETCNQRTLRKLLVSDVLETCQLQMGMTELAPGSVWNTMPCHTHSRRMEAYMYFNLPEDQAVCHFMGPPQQTRTIWMANEQAVISPTWSLHSGVGTSNYTFIWGMAGENLDYGDMDHVQPNELR